MIQNKFNKFLQHRQSLLFQYKMGDLTKNEFIEAIFNTIERLGIKPFKRIDNVKKAIYNYQYFNALAKYYYRLSRDFPAGSKQKASLLAQSNSYYYEKDKVTMKLLKLLDFRNVEAYFVKVKSKKLQNKLFEIVIRDPDVLFEINTLSFSYGGMEADDLVLHSKNPFILKRLKEEGVFLDEKKRSVTDSYINQKY
ncbi:MAG: hypothetical protein GX213_08285 [Clostridiaceae bacterium]|nr:hypothetical protein [Clostridiaceae bacterium]